MRNLVDNQHGKGVKQTHIAGNLGAVHVAQVGLVHAGQVAGVGHCRGQRQNQTGYRVRTRLVGKQHHADQCNDQRCNLFPFELLAENHKAQNCGHHWVHEVQRCRRADRDIGIGLIEHEGSRRTKRNADEQHEPQFLFGQAERNLFNQHDDEQHGHDQQVAIKGQCIGITAHIERLAGQYGCDTEQQC